MANFRFNLDASMQVVERGNNVPTKIISEGLMSDTSNAVDCFTRQRFSGDLQAYLVNYVISISGYYSVYG